MPRRVSQATDDFRHSHKNNEFSNIILFQFVVLTTCDRLKTDVYSLCIMQLSFIISYYWSHVTSTLYKPDTSIRRTVELGPNVVHRRESSLYCTVISQAEVKFWIVSLIINKYWERNPSETLVRGEHS